MNRWTAANPVWFRRACEAMWRCRSSFWFEPQSVSKPTVISLDILWEMRWLPRLSQPVQCKDRKSQGSTPHTPTRKSLNSNAATGKINRKIHHFCLFHPETWNNQRGYCFLLSLNINKWVKLWKMYTKGTVMNGKTCPCYANWLKGS